VTQDRHALALLDPQVGQAEGDLLDRVAEAGVADVTPLVADLVLERDTVGRSCGRELDDVGDRLRAGARVSGADRACFHL
jgi:hypothetical protein